MPELRLIMESDVDIAVYFKPKSKYLEWEEFDIKYDTEDEIWLDLERLMKRNVDLIVLNRARSSIASSAINGIPITIKDRGLYLDIRWRGIKEFIKDSEPVYKQLIEGVKKIIFTSY